MELQPPPGHAPHIVCRTFNSEWREHVAEQRRFTRRSLSERNTQRGAVSQSNYCHYLVERGRASSPAKHFPILAFFFPFSLASLFTFALYIWNHIILDTIQASWLAVLQWKSLNVVLSLSGKNTIVCFTFCIQHEQTHRKQNENCGTAVNAWPWCSYGLSRFESDLQRLIFVPFFPYALIRQKRM